MSSIVGVGRESLCEEVTIHDERRRVNRMSGVTLPRDSGRGAAPSQGSR